MLTADGSSNLLHGLSIASVAVAGGSVFTTLVALIGPIIGRMIIAKAKAAEHDTARITVTSSHIVMSIAAIMDRSHLAHLPTSADAAPDPHPAALTPVPHRPTSISHDDQPDR